MWLCGFYDGAFHVESFLALCSRVFSPIGIVITSLGKSEIVYVLLVHLFVYFTHVDFCPSSLLLGVGGWLQLVIVTLPVLFLLTFSQVF